ncbi:MAG: hypothetical protein ACOY93_18510, partial [Bacillota bacterium]
MIGLVPLSANTQEIGTNPITVSFPFPWRMTPAPGMKTSNGAVLRTSTTDYYLFYVFIRVIRV